MPRKPAAPKAKKTPVVVQPVNPADRAILYVKAGQTVGWKDLYVWDVRAKVYVKDVLEANASEGWYDQVLRNPDGSLQQRGMGTAFRRVRRAIEIHRRPRKPK